MPRQVITAGVNLKEVDSMKCNRRIFSLLLAICLVAALIPATVFAQPYMSNALEEDQVVEYVGEDWLVLDNSAGQLVLLLKTPGEAIAYNASGLSNEWDSSDAKAWCDKFAAEHNIPFAVSFLTYNELINYWINNAESNLDSTSGWWLRVDPNDNVSAGGDMFAIAVSDAGFVGTPHVASNYGARPVVKIPISSIAMIDDGSLVVVDEDAFEDFTASTVVSGNFETATVTYSGAEGGKIYVLLTDRLGEIISCDTFDAAASGSVSVNVKSGLVGWHTVRVFNVVDGVASAVYTEDFNIEDTLGNVTEWNINVGGDISANFNIVLADGVSKENAKVVVKHNGVAKEIEGSALTDGTTTNGDACFKLPVDLHAPQMNDKITIQIVANGETGGEQSFTIREYAEAIINGNYGSEVVNLVKNMLNYGAAAQSYFEYNTGDLANKNIGEIAQDAVPGVPEGGLPAKKPNTVPGISFYGASLVLNSQTTLRFYFTLDQGRNISEFDFGDKIVQKRIAGGTVMYFVDVENIAPNMLNTEQEISVNDVVIVSYNPMWYIQRQFYSNSNTAKFKNLLQAIYNYYLAADAYTAI